jgi:hypothetical protein
MKRIRSLCLSVPILVLLAVAVFLCGCEDDDNPEGFSGGSASESGASGVINAAGTWDLTIAGEGGRTMTINQTGATLDGFVREAVAGVQTNTPLIGQVGESAISFRCAVGGESVAFNGTVAGASMQGTYRNYDAGEIGTWAAFR